MIFIKEKQTGNAYIDFPVWTQLQMIYGYLIISIDEKIYFMTSVDNSVMYRDVTDCFELDNIEVGNKYKVVCLERDGVLQERIFKLETINNYLVFVSDTESYEFQSFFSNFAFCNPTQLIEDPKN